MDYMEYATSPLMWGIAGLAVAAALLQAALFTRKAVKTAQGMDLSQDQLRLAAKASVVSSIGPSLAIVGGMLPILVSLGGAISWIRIGLIGSVGYELMAAGFGAGAAGGMLGETLTPMAYSNAVLCMCAGTIGYLLMPVFFIGKLDGLRNRLAGGNSALIPIISAAAMIGAFSYLTVDQVFTYDIKRIISVIVGFGIMCVFCWMEKTKQVRWTKEWGITIAMFCGMAAACLF